MEIIDDELLDFFRESFRCEWCKKATIVDCHHYWYRRGIGGGSRLDHPWNLVSLCRADHDAHHQGNVPTRTDLLAIVAAREGVLQDDIIAELLRLRNLPREERKWKR